MPETGTDQLAELVNLQRHQTLRLDQIRVMLGVLLAIACVTGFVFLAAVLT